MMNSKAAQQAREKGLAPKEFVSKMQPGAVFAVKDELVDFPEERLPTAGPRDLHGTRRVIIVQNVAWCRSMNPKTLLIVPAHTIGENEVVDPWDFEIPKGEAAFNAPRVLAYASLVQPMLKSDLTTHYGQLSATALKDLQKVIVTNFGLLSPVSMTMPPR